MADAAEDERAALIMSCHGAKMSYVASDERLPVVNALLSNGSC